MVIEMINQDLINEALLFAAQKHEGMKMKQPAVSYVAHLQGVCLEAVTGCLNDSSTVNIEKVIILSLLHDTLEDTDATYNEIQEKFGLEIADGVLALTKNKSLPHEESMIDSLQRIKKQSKEVWIVKLADRLFNLKDVPQQWDAQKRESYKNQAILILEQLGEANNFLANRLQTKINLYNK